MSSKRIGYIDALRGLAMLLVVMGHVGFFMLDAKDMPLFKIIYSFHVPLFFFISGFLAYKQKPLPIAALPLSLIKKIRELIVPPVAFFILLLLINPWYNSGRMGFNTLLNGYFGGYWFTIVLFEMFLIYYLSNLCIAKYKIGGVIH